MVQVQKVFWQPPKAEKAFTKLAIEQQRAADEEGADTQLHLTRNILADTFHEFESGIQKIVDNERSLKFKCAIPNAIAAYKYLYHEVSQAKQMRMTVYQNNNLW